jgi:hypothetical protein
LINTQAYRSAKRINIEHSIENVGEPLNKYSKSQITYRRKEMRLKKIFYGIFAVVIALIGGAPIFLFTTYQYSAFMMCFIVFGIQLVVMPIIFGNMICTMKAHTPGQYKKF